MKLIDFFPLSLNANVATVDLLLLIRPFATLNRRDLSVSSNDSRLALDFRDVWFLDGLKDSQALSWIVCKQEEIKGFEENLKKIVSYPAHHTIDGFAIDAPVGEWLFANKICSGAV